VATSLPRSGGHLTWDVPQFHHMMPAPHRTVDYTIKQDDLDVLRFAHFCAAAITVRFLRKDGAGLKRAG